MELIICSGVPCKHGLEHELSNNTICIVYVLKKLLLMEKHRCLALDDDFIYGVKLLIIASKMSLHIWHKRLNRVFGTEGLKTYFVKFRIKAFSYNSMNLHCH